MISEEFRQEYLNNLDYIIARTSGSTGMPKEIRLPKSLLRLSSRRTNEFFGITRDSILYSIVSPEFIGGKMMIVRSIEAGCRELYFEKPTNRPLLKAPYISLLAAVPSQMWHILDNKDILPPIEAIIVGGQKIPLALHKRIAASSLNVYETYGMTETASHIALRPVTDNPDLPFQTLPGVSVMTDENHRLIISQGDEEPVVTNDIAQIVAPGKFRILGRYDNVIISGGRKIFPEVIERKAEAATGMRPIVVSSRPDDKWGDALIFNIEGLEPLDADVLNMLRSVLEPWEMPKDIRYIAGFPRTATGKILRNELSQYDEEFRHG